MHGKEIMHLYHYVSLNGTPADDYRRQMISKRQIYFSDPCNFDDALDCNVPGWEAAKGKLIDCRVFCLSMEDRDDNLMFALYGDHHKGLRLRFTINRELPMSKCTHLANGRPVEYVNCLPPYDEQRAHMYFYYKAISWEYQREYRVLMPRESGEYSKSELTEIALGLKFDMRHLRKLAEWIHEGGHTNVTFKRAIRINSIFGIEYGPIVV
jgi:hypothetical protein